MMLIGSTMRMSSEEMATHHAECQSAMASGNSTFQSPE